MNKLIISGRLTRDPELKALSGDNMVAKFTVAVNRPYKDKETGERPADFIPCEAFGKTAEFISNYVTKGRLVEVEGEMRVDKYTTEEGENRTFTKCHVNTLNVLDSAKTVTDTETETASKPASKTATKPTAKKPGVKKPAVAK